MVHGHRDLDVWKKSMSFVTTVYKLTKNFPHEEIYGLTNQMRRAAVSVPSNIAEGAARASEKEFIQFLYIALGSLSGLETQILIAVNLEYLGSSDALIAETSILRKLLNGLIFSLKNKSENMKA